MKLTTFGFFGFFVFFKWAWQGLGQKRAHAWPTKEGQLLPSPHQLSPCKNASPALSDVDGFTRDARNVTFYVETV